MVEARKLPQMRQLQESRTASHFHLHDSGSCHRPAGPGTESARLDALRGPLATCLAHAIPKTAMAPGRASSNRQSGSSASLATLKGCGQWPDSDAASAGIPQLAWSHVVRQLGSRCGAAPGGCPENLSNAFAVAQRAILDNGRRTTSSYKASSWLPEAISID